MRKPTQEELEELLARSISGILPNREAFEKRLLNGKPMTIYLGADATGPELHLGHATNFLFLEKLRALGHHVIVLFGDFTAMIGDPSDKEAERRTLSKKEVGENIKSWKKQVGKILNLTDKKNPAKILKNSSWLARLTFDKILELAGSFTVQQMIERDMFQKRINDGKPVYLHEFLYPLMQGFDSVVMNVDTEVGGNDQLFNMMAGRTLQKKYNNKDKIVITTTLLINPKTGKKLMSKSEGSYIALSDSPEEMFGKTMALPDEVIPQMFTDCTLLSLGEIANIKKELVDGVNPRDIKMKLAYEITALYHGEKPAGIARDNFARVFQKREIPEEVTVITMKNQDVAAALVKNKIVASKSELRRLISAGAVTHLEEKNKVTDIGYLNSHRGTYKIGSRRFVRIVN